jgi:hypothetical protein
MNELNSNWHPTYTITPATAAVLMQIEANRTVVEQTPLSLAVQEELRRRTRDLLLPKLISGELDVENIDVKMPNNGGA